MDTTFGNLDGRQLTLRWITPFAFHVWTGSDWRFSWRELLRPRLWFLWLRALRYWTNWRVGCRRQVGNTHRCYCPDGWLLDGELVIAGWGLIWFYSHYTGEVPCTCDKVIAEMFPNEEQAHA